MLLSSPVCLQLLPLLLKAQKPVVLPTSSFKIPFISVHETPRPKPKPRVELPPPPPIDPSEVPPASRDGTAGQTPKSVVKSEPSAGTSKLLPTPAPKKPSKSSASKPSKRKHSPEVNPEEEQDPDFSPPPTKKTKTKQAPHISFVTVTEGFAPEEVLVPKKKKRKKKVEDPPAEFMEDAPVASTSAVMLPPRKRQSLVAAQRHTLQMANWEPPALTRQTHTYWREVDTSIRVSLLQSHVPKECCIHSGEVGLSKESQTLDGTIGLISREAVVVSDDSDSSAGSITGVRKLGSVCHTAESEIDDIGIWQIRGASGRETKDRVRALGLCPDIKLRRVVKR
ncbi:hypothetical protein C8R46DRAFT_1042380 [Mycena filopes]|nr:hypothetical protein C8R46DRAFT_1042380 [Mycena filopes]